MQQPYEQLPSGKAIIRRFDAAGAMTSETHSYGAVDIAIRTEFGGGAKIGETYIVKKRLVSRVRYEKARVDYPDMPTADGALEDLCGELVKNAHRERRERAKAAKTHTPDPEQARRHDIFCQELLNEGRREDAAAWIESPQHTLGERSHAASRKLVAKLLQLGCPHVYACQIDEYSTGQANTGHLVVELPMDRQGRKAVLRETTRLAAAQGYDGDLDDGQQFAYIKLD